MPVKKSTEVSSSYSSSPRTSMHNESCTSGVWASYGPFGRKFLGTLLGILLVYGIILVGTMIRNNLRTYNSIGRADKMERTIAVEAEGKVVVTPNIAITSMGMTADGKNVADAQQKNTDVMNKLTEKVKALGVAKSDIQTTNYSIYPVYDYADGKQTIRGYQVSQSVTIKIRDLTKANAVLAIAGEVGANNVSGLQFTIDDRDAYKEKAREEALKKVAAKRDALAAALGVNMNTVVTYNEYEVTGGNGYYKEADGMGGMGAGPASAPSVESGSNEVVMHVSVVFEAQ